MELVLYYIKENGILLLSFLILIFVIGLFAYMTMRNFRQDSKLKVGFYGLFLGLKNIDIIKISTVVLRALLVFYAVMVTAEYKVYMCLIMIALLTIIYICLYPNKLVNDIVCTFMEIAMIYFIYIINNYMVEIEYSSTIMMIKICLTVFSILLAVYFFLRDLNVIVENRWDKEFEKSRKELKDVK